MFRDGLKQEMRLMKQEIDMLPKDGRKDVMRRRKEEKEIEQAEKVIHLRRTKQTVTQITTNSWLACLMSC